MPRCLLPTLLLCLAPAGLRAEDRFLDSNGVRIHYTVVGRGEPVLLIHGFAASIETQWGLPGIIQELSRDYRVITLDNRGHGRSGKPHEAGRYGPEMAEDAVRLLDHLQVRRAHVVGYSMGAAITGKLLVTHPDRLLSATLGGAGALLEGTDTRPLDALADSLERGQGFGSLLAALTPPGRPRPTEEQVRAADLVLTSLNDVRALAAVARGMKGLAITRAQAGAVRVPTLNGLSGELVEDVAASIAQTVPSVVRDTLLALLTKGRGDPDLPERDRSHWSANRPSLLWGGTDEEDEPMWPDEQKPGRGGRTGTTTATGPARGCTSRGESVAVGDRAAWQRLWDGH